MLSASIKNIKRHVSNMAGWSTSRKIVVIESDDWGSIRMPSLAALERLIEKKVDIISGDNFRYNQNDTLANTADMHSLFETLQKYKDVKGNPAVFTAVTIVANPDFEKIRQHRFQEYFYEPFTQTLERYYGNTDVFRLWMQGVQNNLFVPQFHGREHLNVAAWMKALQINDEATHFAFDEGCWGFNNKSPFGVKYQAAFDLSDPSELQQQRQIVKEGLDLFEDIFGYRASFFVPPNGPFNNDLEETAAAGGIKFMSGSRIQKEALGLGKTKRRFHYLGQQNKYKQFYLTRNCFFEPNHPERDWVQSCLKEIETAFFWNKPAIISSHRVNYIGALNEDNRKRGLFQLADLLNKVICKWPDIEFMTSDKLGRLIAKS